MFEGAGGAIIGYRVYIRLFHLLSTAFHLNRFSISKNSIDFANTNLASSSDCFFLNYNMQFENHSWSDFNGGDFIFGLKDFNFHSIETM